MKGHRSARRCAAACPAVRRSRASRQQGRRQGRRVLPLTGNTAWAGKTNRIAAAIAAEEVNAQDLAVEDRTCVRRQPM
jgi:hypothetical protein